MNIGKPSIRRIMLPVGLPTLHVAWLELPHPMTEAEFDAVIETLVMCKEALTSPIPVQAEVSEVQK